MSEMVFNWAGMPQQPSVDFASGIQTTDSIINERRQAFDQRKSEIAQLQAELAQIDAQIAAFDRENPGIASGDIGVAASLMEAGNIGPYQQMVGAAQAREQIGSSSIKNAEQSIRNAIGNARNAIAGHERMQAFEKGQAFDLARVQLDEAKHIAEQAGMELPSEFYAVEQIIGNKKGSPSTGSEEWLNNEDTARGYLEKLVREKKLTNNEIKKLEYYANEQFDDELALKLGNLANEYRRKTNESVKARNKRKDKAKAEAAKFSGVNDVDVRVRMYDEGSKELKEFFSMDAKGNLREKGK